MIAHIIHDATESLSKNRRKIAPVGGDFYEERHLARIISHVESVVSKDVDSREQLRYIKESVLCNHTILRDAMSARFLNCVGWSKNVRKEKYPALIL